MITNDNEKFAFLPSLTYTVPLTMYRLWSDTEYNTV